MRQIRQYLANNLLTGLSVSPFKASRKPWIAALLFGLFALVIGLATGLFHVELLHHPMAIFLPFSLFVFPALLEEVFFRGILIPVDTSGKGNRQVLLMSALSTVLFVLWHPLNAMTINPSAAPLFTDPRFLLIVALLGATCSYGYIVSRSLWIPVLIHWGTILAWVFLLGGRNLVLEM